MKRKVLAVFAVALVATAFGERSLKPGIDAFNASVPAESSKTVAFSPFSFELDCCVFAESLDPIGRANVSEKLSVMTDFTGAYYPVLDALESAAPTNRVFFLSARTIGVTEIPKVNPDFKRRIFELRTNASISLLTPTRGAERWVRAKLDGWMEDFTMPIPKVGREEYSLVDAAVVAATVKDDADCQEQECEFLPGGDAKVKIPFLRFRAQADFLRSEEKTIVRIPMRGDAFLFIAVPGKDKTLADLRKSITGENMQSLVLEPIDPNLKGNGSAVCEFAMPKLDFMSQTDIEKSFETMGIPANDILYLYKDLSKRSSSQTVRFKLEKGEVPDGASALPAATEKFEFNHPFVFFVYVPETNIIPVVGQFTGE